MQHTTATDQEPRSQRTIGRATMLRGLPLFPAPTTGGSHGAAHVAPFAGWEIAALAICMSVSLLLRLQRLDGPSLWMDEVASWTFITLSWSDLLGRVAQLEPNPPGYYALLKLASSVLGTSDLALRLPSALAGAAALLPIALYTRRAFGPAAAAIAMLLLTASASHIHYSQQARTYSVLFLCAATALWLQARMLEPNIPTRRRLARMLPYAAVGIVMMHLHATAVFIVAALYVQAGVLLLVSRRLGWAEVAALAVAGMMILAGSAWWLSIAIRIAGDEQSAISWLLAPDLADALRIVTNTLGALYLDRIRGIMALASGLLLGAALALAVWRRQAEALSLAAALGFGATSLYAASQAAPVMLERTALFLLIFAMPLYGFILAAVRPRWIGLAAATLLLLLQMRAVDNRIAVLAMQGHGEDWRAAVAHLAQRFAPGEPILVLGSFDAGAIAHYAPALAPQATIRTVVLPSNNLGRAVVTGLTFVRPFDPMELCRIADANGLWSLGRENASEVEVEFLEATMARYGSTTVASSNFEQVVLRRWSQPYCDGSR